MFRALLCVAGINQRLVVDIFARPSPSVLVVSGEWHQHRKQIALNRKIVVLYINSDSHKFPPIRNVCFVRPTFLPKIQTR